MAQQYVSLEEAASILGVSVEEVKSLRESGELRGFSDKGTWKFRRDHLEEFSRDRGSDADIPILGESGPGASDLFRIHTGEETTDSDETGRQEIPGMDLSGEGDDGDFEFGTESDFAAPANTEPPKPKPRPAAASDDSGDFIVEEFEVPDEVEIDSSDSTGKLERPAATADSGVNLDPDEVGSVDAELHEHDSGIILADVDSGVNVGSSIDVGSGLDVGSSDVLEDESDLGLILSGSDVEGSDIADIEVGSDVSGSVIGGSDLGGSDVLDLDGDAAEPPSLTEEDSRVLIGAEALSGTDFVGDSDVSKIDSDIDLTADVTAEVAAEAEDDDSGIALDTGDESGIALDFGDESGIALDLGGDEESGIALDLGGDDESGIALDFADESGIALDAGDSGIALDTGDSGIALDAGDSGIALDAGDSGLALDYADSDVDAGGVAEGTQRMPVQAAGASDDEDDFADFEDEAEADATQRVPVGAGLIDSEAELEGPAEDLDDFDDGEVFDEIDDELVDEFDEVDEFDDEDELAAVPSGLDEDLFDEDDDFAAVPSAKAKPSGPQWGAVPFIGLTLCTVVMLASAMMTWQSMRVMWTGAPETATAFDQVVDQLTGLIP